MFDGKVGNVMNAAQARAYACPVDARDCDDSGMGAWPDPPYVQVGNAGVSRSFDDMPDFVFYAAFVRVEQDVRGVAHERP